MALRLRVRNVGVGVVVVVVDAGRVAVVIIRFLVALMSGRYTISGAILFGLVGLLLCGLFGLWVKLL